MKIVDLLKRESVELNGKVTSKPEAIEKMVALMAAGGNLADVEAYKKGVFAREEESTTGIGEGIAIPHGKCDAVQKPGLAAMVVKNGVEFEALDDEPVTLLFLIAAPNTEDNIHLDVLSKLSVMLMDEEFTASLRNAQSVDEFMEIIDKADDEKKDIDERLADTGSADEGQVKILAVTSCPTGIAHTYMAAEGIEKAADSCLEQEDIFPQAVEQLASISIKKHEPGLLALAEKKKLPFLTFEGEELMKVQGDFTPSAFVKSVTGADNVCERSAVLGAAKGKLIKRKSGGDGVTTALALREWEVHFE